MTYVSEHPGHDRRCAIDATKIRLYLGSLPTVDLEGGLQATLRWF